jgi:hypothetical protein
MRPFVTIRSSMSSISQTRVYNTKKEDKGFGVMPLFPSPLSINFCLQLFSEYVERWARKAK